MSPTLLKTIKRSRKLFHVHCSVCIVFGLALVLLLLIDSSFPASFFYCRFTVTFISFSTRSSIKRFRSLVCNRNWVEFSLSLSLYCCRGLARKFNNSLSTVGEELTSSYPCSQHHEHLKTWNKSDRSE